MPIDTSLTVFHRAGTAVMFTGPLTTVEEIFGEDLNVTTNAVERLFGHLKQHLRQRRYGKISKGHYGKVLSEFLWRQRVSAFGTELLKNLLETISKLENT